jgi:hypothetical protein
MDLSSKFKIIYRAIEVLLTFARSQGDRAWEICELESGVLMNEKIGREHVGWSDQDSPKRQAKFSV